MKHWHVKFNDDRSDLPHFINIWAETVVMAVAHAAIQPFPKDTSDMSFLTKVEAVEIE